MCGFPQGVTNILDPAQTGQPWTPARVMQFGGYSAAHQAKYGVNADGTPIGGMGGGTDPRQRFQDTKLGGGSGGGGGGSAGSLGTALGTTR